MLRSYGIEFDSARIILGGSAKDTAARGKSLAKREVIR
jgi:hypothetical protein